MLNALEVIALRLNLSLYLYALFSILILLFTSVTLSNSSLFLNTISDTNEERSAMAILNLMNNNASTAPTSLSNPSPVGNAGHNQNSNENAPLISEGKTKHVTLIASEIPVKVAPIMLCILVV